MMKKEKRIITVSEKSLRRRQLRRAVCSCAVVCLVAAIMVVFAAFAVSAAMVASSRSRVISAGAASELENVDCILVLGAGVRDDGSPSDMLYDRVRTGISLFESGASDRLLMSGDHGRVDYDEVNVMKSLAVGAGIDPDAVFCDHAGFSTYESIYRARDIFGAGRIIIVSQEYHLYRALYIARKLGLEAYGVSADLRSYRGQAYRDLREDLARFKDFFTAQLQPLPTYLGEAIPLSGSGSLTDG